MTKIPLHIFYGLFFPFVDLLPIALYCVISIALGFNKIKNEICKMDTSLVRWMREKREKKKI